VKDSFQLSAISCQPGTYEEIAAAQLLGLLCRAALKGCATER
jgi:hypothetical protein